MSTIRIRFADGTIEERPGTCPTFLVNPTPARPEQAAWSNGDAANRRPGWRMPCMYVAVPLRERAAVDPTLWRSPTFVWRDIEGGRWEWCEVETFEEQIERLQSR